VPRYLVERTFPGGLAVCPGEALAVMLCGVIERNAELGVTWLHSYVSDDKETLVCVYDGPAPEAIRKAAELNGLPVDRITEVSVLDPHFYR
jgi:Nickel responsive protein SCO4226-like